MQEELKSRGRRLFLASVASVFPVTTGCIHGEESPPEEGGSEDEGGDRGAPEELPYSTFDVIHVEEGSLVAFEMVNHWHFQPIEVEVDGELPVWFRADLSQVEDTPSVDLDGSHDVEMEVVGGDSSIVSAEESEDPAGDLVIEGDRTGEVDVAFAVVDGSGDVLYRTQPVPLHVEGR